MSKLVATLLGGTMLAFAMPAHATLQFSADINGTPFACQDGAGCDTSAGTPNLLTTNPGTFGGVSISQTQQQAIYGPPTNALFTNSLAIHNTLTTVATISIAVGATSFTPPTTSFSAAGTGTWLNADNSTIQMQWYGDTANGQGADSPFDAPGTQLASSGLITAGAGADQYGFNQDGAFVTSGPFSWTMLAQLTLQPGQTATLLGRSQDITNNVVPEPGSLAMLGSALLGLGAFMWWRRRDSNDRGDGALA